MTHSQDYCHTHGIKLTPLRQQVLDILSTEQQPLTAYAVLDKLKVYNPKAQAMSVYRILDFLQTNHLIHRIENLNAFMVCSHLNERHRSQWLICERCGKTEEYISPTFRQGIKQLEDDTGFQVATPTIELLGICQQCQENGETLDTDTW